MRKLAYTLAALLAANAGMDSAWALGLGQIKVNTSLNQPLDAEIKLLSIPRGDIGNIKVNLASAEAFKRAGLERPYILSELNFNVEPLEEKVAMVRVFSDQPIKEPFLNFLVEVSWPGGRILREYTVLLDPPTYKDKADAAVIAAVSQPDATAVTPAIHAPSQDTQEAAPKRGGGMRAASAQGKSASGGNTAVGGNAAVAGISGNEYTTQHGDSLWKIASRHTGGSAVHSAMKMIYENNPHAFINSNIHQLKTGQALQLPDSTQLAAVNEQEALAFYNQNRSAWQNYRQAAAESSTETPVSAPSGQPRKSAQASDGGLSIASVADTPRTGIPDSAAGSGQGSAAWQGKFSEVIAENKVLRTDLEATRKMVTDIKNQMDSLVKIQNNLMAQLEALNKSGVALSPSMKEQADKVLKDWQAAQEAAKVSAKSEVKLPEVKSPEVKSPEAKPPEVKLPEVKPPEVKPPVEVADAASAQGAPAAETAGASSSGAEAVKPAQPHQAKTAETSASAPANNATAGAQAGSGPAPGEQDEPPQAESKPQPPQPEEIATPNFIQTYLSPVAEAVPFGWAGLGGGLGALLAGTGAFLFMRRRRAYQKEQADLANASSSPVTELDPLGEEELESMADEQSFDTLAEQADTLASAVDEEGVLEEADVYISYERYEQAQEVLERALEHYPDNQEYRLKLLEVHAAHGDPDAFAREAQALHRAENGQGPRWETATRLWDSMGTEQTLLVAIGGAAAFATGGADADTFDTLDTLDSPQPDSGDDELNALLASTGNGENDGLDDLDNLGGSMDDLDLGSLEDELNLDDLSDGENMPLDMDLGNATANAMPAEEDLDGLDLDINAMTDHGAAQDDGLDGLDLDLHAMTTDHNAQEDGLDGLDLDLHAATTDHNATQDDGLDGLDLDLHAAATDHNAAHDDGLDGLDLDFAAQTPMDTATQPAGGEEAFNLDDLDSLFGESASSLDVAPESMADNGQAEGEPGGLNLEGHDSDLSTNLDALDFNLEKTDAESSLADMEPAAMDSEDLAGSGEGELDFNLDNLGLGDEPDFAGMDSDAGTEAEEADLTALSSDNRLEDMQDSEASDAQQDLTMASFDGLDGLDGMELGQADTDSTGLGSDNRLENMQDSEASDAQQDLTMASFDGLDGLDGLDGMELGQVDTDGTGGTEEDITEMDLAALLGSDADSGALDMDGNASDADLAAFVAANQDDPTADAREAEDADMLNTGTDEEIDFSSLGLDQDGGLEDMDTTFDTNLDASDLDLDSLLSGGDAAFDLDELELDKK